jgi:hypothetical protein
MARRFPAPWTVERIAGGFKVLDANGQSLAYVYSRETKDAADIAMWPKRYRKTRGPCSPSYFLRLRSQMSAAIDPTTPIAAIPENASISGTTTPSA